MIPARRVSPIDKPPQSPAGAGAVRSLTDCEVSELANKLALTHVKGYLRAFRDLAPFLGTARITSREIP